MSGCYGKKKDFNCKQSETKTASEVVTRAFGLFQIALGNLKWQLLHIYQNIMHLTKSLTDPL